MTDRPLMDAATRAAVLKLGQELGRIRRDVDDLKRGNRAAGLAWSSIEAGTVPVNDEDGTPRQILGRQDDGSYTSRDLNGPPPPTPAAPGVDVQPGLLVVTSYGERADGLDWPYDTARIDVHVGAPGFIPTVASRVASVAPYAGGSVPVALDPGGWAALLVAVNTSGAWSLPSAEAAGTVPQPVTSGGVRTYRSATAPVGLGIDDEGAIWYDTDDLNRPYRWDGVAWVDVRDGLAAQAIVAADGKSTVHYLDAATFAASPPAGVAGDLLFLTDDAQAAFRWAEGSGWVRIEFGPDAIQADAITQAKIAAGAVGTGQIAGQAVDTSKLADGSVDATKLVESVNTDISTALSTAQDAAGEASRVRTSIGTTAPTSPGVGDLWVDTTVGVVKRWGGSSWASVVLGTDSIAADAVTSALLAANSVVAGKIAAGVVGANELAANSVVAGKIAANAVGASQLVAGSVQAGKIAAGAVLTESLAADAVTAGKIAAGAVTAAAIDAGAVTAAKLAAGSVTADKLAATSVDVSKLTVAALPSENLIKNGDFEVWPDILANTFPAGWGGSASVTRLSGPSVIAGSYSMQFPCDPAGVERSAYTDLVPVAPGMEYTASCMAAATATSGVFPDMSFQILWYAADQTYVSSQTRAGSVLASDPAPLSLSATAPATARYARVRILTDFAGTQRVFVDTVALRPTYSGAMRSGDYTEGETGWQITSEQTQFQNLNVLDNLGADVVTANTIALGADDLRGDLIDPKADGATAAALGDKVKDTAGIGTNENAMFELNAGQAYANRFYRLTVQGLLFDAQARTGSYDLRIRYTTDGSFPTTGSPVLDGSQYRVNIEGVGSVSFNFDALYQLATDSTPRFLLTMQRASGSCFAQIWNTTADRRPLFIFEDLGSAIALGSLSQRSIDGGGSQPDPKATYTVSFRPTWTRSFNGDGTVWQNFGTETPDLYQGYYSGTHGNTKSMAGGFVRFSSGAAITSVLAGSTINRVRMSCRVRHSGAGSGLDLNVYQHSAAAKPATYPGAGALLAQRDNITAGSTTTFDLPIAFGNALRDGSMRGVAFETGSTALSDYGYLYGLGGSQPLLTITYTK